MANLLIYYRIICLSRKPDYSISIILTKLFCFIDIQEKLFLLALIATLKGLWNVHETVNRMHIMYLIKWKLSIPGINVY